MWCSGYGDVFCVVVFVVNVDVGVFEGFDVGGVIGFDVVVGTSTGGPSVFSNRQRQSST